jgi:hypothetical protein
MYKKIREWVSKNLLWTIVIILLALVTLATISLNISNEVNKGNFGIDIIYLLLNTTISVLIFSLLWQSLEKRLFAEDLLNLAKISSNIQDSGIISYYDSFLDIEWDRQFYESKNLQMFFTFAITFGQHNRVKIEKAISKGLKVEVYYPNIKNKVILDELNSRFDQTDPNWTYNKVRESIKLYKDLGASVYMFNGNISASYYLFDNIAYMSYFNHNNKKKTVPCIEVKKGGNLFNYINEEMSIITKRSELINEEQL